MIMSKVVIKCKKTYEAVQHEYAHIGRLTELHFNRGLYTREFFDKKVEQALLRIDAIEADAIARYIEKEQKD